MDQELPISVATTEAEAAIELEVPIINPTTDPELMAKIIMSANMSLKKIIKKVKILMKMYTKRNLKDTRTIKVTEVAVVVLIIITTTMANIIKMIDNSTEKLNMRCMPKSHIKVASRCQLQIKLN